MVIGVDKMFRAMRRIKQQLTVEEARAVLENCTSGVLSLIGDDGYPYGVPLSYVLVGDKIYFHCAQEGHKIDAITRDGRASFCVIAADEVIPEKYTTAYQSVIVFGQIRILTDEVEKRMAIQKLAARYSPEESAESREDEINQFWQQLCMLELTIEQITGKQGLEMMRRHSK